MVKDGIAMVRTFSGWAAAGVVDGDRHRSDPHGPHPRVRIYDAL
jgi:hypothetical protein